MTKLFFQYRNVRGQQLERVFNSLLPDSDSENVNYKEFSCNCGQVAEQIIDMIEEDFTVLCTGVFKKIGGKSTKIFIMIFS